MIFAFYLSAAVAVVATFMVVISLNVVHALLYLVVSLISVGIIFFILGASFVAVLQVVIYAGAIIVFFAFVIMILNMGPAAEAQEKEWMKPRTWAGPSVLALILFTELLYILSTGDVSPDVKVRDFSPRDVGMALFGPYLLAVELASMLLLVASVGAYHLAYHLGRREVKKRQGDQL
jgi:NADH-quinone oxidoreductase subunit J